MDAGNGFALLAVRNSRHFAALWPDVEPLARRLGGAGSGQQHGLRGAQRRHPGAVRYQPTAFAAPRAGHDPLVFELATSAIAPGEVRSLRAMPSPSAAKPCRALGGAGQTRQPGERRYRQRERLLQEGVALPVGTWAEPQRLAGRRLEGKRLQRFPINR